MDSKQIDVMVADASHEVYVDKILDTIREAAKVRGTGIAERTHEYVATKMKEGNHSFMWRRICRFHLHRELGKQAVCGNIGPHRTSRLPWLGTGKTYQDRFFPPGTPAVAQSQDIQSDQRSGRYENEYRTGLRTGYFQ